MSTTTSSAPSEDVLTGFAGRLFRWSYSLIGHLGLMSIFGSQLYGFRYLPTAHAINFVYDFLLYCCFVIPHLVMTRSWYKRLVTGDPAGSPAERRVYILVSVLTWLVVFYFAWPLPGGEWSLEGFAEPLRFIGILAFLWSLMLFFQGISFEMLNGLLAVPGSASQFSHGGETPLATEGPYAQVRHPMYRAATLIGLSSLLIHPNAAQLCWVVAIAATFIGFIPIEEAQLIAARGDDYRRYQERTPYRLFRGIW